MTSGISFRIRDLDILRSQVDGIPGTDELGDQLVALDAWRRSLGVPHLPSADESGGVTAPMSEDVVASLETMVAVLVFGIRFVDETAFWPLVALCVELDSSDPWSEAQVATDTPIAATSRLGLLALTSGAVVHTA